MQRKVEHKNMIQVHSSITTASTQCNTSLMSFCEHVWTGYMSDEAAEHVLPSELTKPATCTNYSRLNDTLNSHISTSGTMQFM